MNRDYLTFQCAIIRGGTSKGLFIKDNELPPPGDQRDRIILRLMGSPDQRQIDGLGGANSLTSKVSIIGPSSRTDADVDYTFGQVSVDKAKIDWQGNCGNLTSAVGVFAVNQNYVPACEPVTTVRIFNTNTAKIIHVKVPVRAGRAANDGDCMIHGVPGTGARLEVEFFDPAGAVTGQLLPTGHVKDVIDLGNRGKFTISIVDAVSPVVYLRASELGLAGTELPTEVENMPQVLALMEELRCRAAELAGIVKDWRTATEQSPAFPKVGFVSPARGYRNPDGRMIEANDIDIVARLGSMQKMHRAYMIGGAVSTGAAAQLPGTVVWEAMSERARTDGRTVIIGQPYGPMEVHVDSTGGTIRKVGVFRTARVIMEGTAYIPGNTLA